MTCPHAEDCPKVYLVCRECGEEVPEKEEVPCGPVTAICPAGFDLDACREGILADEADRRYHEEER